MYREAATAGVIKGVLSGPYVGGPRKIDVAKLGLVTRQRLAAVLESHAEPTPLLEERRWVMPRLPPVVVMLVSLVALCFLTLVDFADRDAATQPLFYALAYQAGCALIVFSTLVILRRLARGSFLPPLPPGRYLLPLDVLDVGVPARDGTQIIEVTPLGDARDARIQKMDGFELVFVYARGAELRFPVRSAAAGEYVLRALELTQTLLEQLTYQPDLARALKNDPLFDIRADDSWAAVAPSAPRLARLHEHRGATVTAVVCGLVLGTTWFSVRNHASMRAVRDRMAAEERREAQRTAAEKEAATPMPDDVNAHRQGRCLATLHRNPSPTYAARAILDSFVYRTEKTGDPVIPIRFERIARTPPAGTYDLDLDMREREIVTALELVFSQSCPAEVVRLERAEPDSAARKQPGIVVATTIAWAPARHFEKLAPTFAFDVTMRGFEVDDPVTFHLTMPPPNPVPLHVRDRSVFSEPDPSSPDRLGDLVTARAYDRLYDEMYSLFFGGEVAVPLP